MKVGLYPWRKEARKMVRKKMKTMIKAPPKKRASNKEKNKEKKKNRFVYTSASVTYKRAGAVMRFRQLFGRNFESLINGGTNGLTVGQTNRLTNRPYKKKQSVHWKVSFSVS